MLATMVDGLMKKIWDLRLVKLGKFGFSQYIPCTLNSLFQSLFFIHITVRIIKSYIYAFSHKITLTYLNANKYEK